MTCKPTGEAIRLLPAVRQAAENGFIETFKNRFRAECLNGHWFLSLAMPRTERETWAHR
ncbi:integrase core domain-containing protein [Bradyrhizobium sacchari]|uniref:integrase core domain-containing protein n=1 Tax=Bradyrhizobium sacchari TaxID=1399419 RepID=UPI00137477E5